MKKIIIGILISILILGFVIPKFYEPTDTCTKKMCYPQEPTAEIECNDCTRSRPIFVIGIVNVIKTCNGKDVLVFEDSQHISDKDHVRLDKGSCEHDMKFFKLK